MNPLKPAVSIHIFPPNRCATGCSICGLSDLPSSTSKILRTQEWLIKAIKVTRYRPLYILFSLYLCLFLLFLILPSYTFFEDMTTAISLLWFANHHESPEVIEFNKWRGFGHISMDQKGTVPGVSWIKVDGFTRPNCVYFPFRVLLGYVTSKKETTWEISRRSTWINDEVLFSVKWIHCSSPILSSKTVFWYIQVTF